MIIRLTTVIQQAAATFVVHGPNRFPRVLPNSERVLFRLAERLAPEFEHGSREMDVHDLEALLSDHLLDEDAFPEVDAWNNTKGFFIDVEQLVRKIVERVGEYEGLSQADERLDMFFDPTDSNDRPSRDEQDFGALIGGGAEE